jgi:hypothetical protein
MEVVDDRVARPELVEARAELRPALDETLRLRAAA